MGEESLITGAGQVEERGAQPQRAPLIAVYGESLIDLIEQPSGLFQAHPGGSPYNMGRAAARQLRPKAVRYLCPLSQDKFGALLASTASADGVELLPERAMEPSALAVVTLNAAGEASYRLYREGVADRSISTDELLDCFKVPSFTPLIFHTGSLALTPTERDQSEALIKLAREQGAAVSVDLNLRPGAVSDQAEYRRGIHALLPDCDLIKLSDEDLLALGYSGEPLTAAARLWGEVSDKRGTPPLFALTLGAEGAALFINGRSAPLYVPAAPLRAHGDTVGAGDSFHGVLLAELLLTAEERGEDLVMLLREGAKGLQDQELTRTLLRATVGAALNVECHGCHPPSREDLLRRSRELIEEQRAHISGGG